MERLKQIVEQKRARTKERNPKYAMRSLSIGFVSCLLGFTMLVSTPITAYATAVPTAITTTAAADGATANAANNAMPENLVTENNWDEQEGTGNDDWGLYQDEGQSPAQRLRRVTLSDPIDIFDVDYEGYFIDAEGRTNLRLVYREKSTVVSGVWHRALFHFDSELYKLIDFDKSYGSSEQDGSNKVLFESSPQANTKGFNIRNLISIRTAMKNNIPINLVLNEGITINDLPQRNLLVQMRLTTSDYKDIYTFAPGKSSMDYSSYTRSTIIPTVTNVDNLFKKGNKPKDELIVAQRAFQTEFIANPERYNDSSNIGILRTAYQWEHKSLAKANSMDPVAKDGKGKPFGYVQAFDAEMLKFLKADASGNVAFTRLLNADRTEYKGSSAYPYVEYGIKKDEINVTPDGKTAYIVLAEDNFKKDGVKVVRIGQMDGSIYEGGSNFTSIDFNMDKELLADAFTTPEGETSQVRYPVMSGWVESNPTGWTAFEDSYDEDATIKAGQMFTVDTTQTPAGGGIMLQVGNEEALLRKQVGNYIDNAGVGRLGGIDKIEEVTPGIFNIYLREGAQIKAGESIKVIMPDTADHVDAVTGNSLPVYFVEIDNYGKKADSTTFEYTSGSQGNLSVVFTGDSEKTDLTYTLSDGTTKTITVDKSSIGFWRSNIPGAGDEYLWKNRAAAGTGAYAYLMRDKLQPGAPITAVTTMKDGSVRTSTVKYKPLTKSTEKYNGMVWTDHSDSLSSIVISKSKYVPFQEVYTNDYTASQDDWYVNPNVAPGTDENFMTKTSAIRGYSHYESGKIRMRYIPPTGDVIIGRAEAIGNEYNDGGEITKDNSQQLTINGTNYSAYSYSIPLSSTTQFFNTTVSNANESPLTLHKDMRLIFNSSDGSALPSNWLDTRVKTRVLFNPTIGQLNAADETGVKIVPDNVKYYAEDGYTVNGFTGENANTSTGDTFAQDPAAPTGKTFLGWVTQAGLDALQTSATEAITTAEKFNNLTKDTEVFTETTPVDTHIVVYAVYSEEQLVTFNANGGTFEDGSSEKKDDITDGVNAPTNPTLDGKEFKGWANTSDAIEPDVTDLNTLKAGETVYAVWGEPDTTAPVITAIDDQKVVAGNEITPVTVT
ncbi:InlB B-repeat-containing protein, partial [Peptoniphilus sp. KCTC 25270]|uniref:InlB B-repeat-containing protein n=1 Tax=Peptoniphilus sp. KCTC 25270 TaxID=2897414 RepID=UPI001E651F8C